ncbi:plasma membrane protein Pth11-like, putative [Talaromyces stipitatus ATCC 10500]|uniref:Plasma membrane protein Pth11-like, putative n=1 Tax=Talaromyces stipitatus (strain ATCC 10500 / CBS 375.48 / QM 6759 / NRRL 1006) TaxID=441959 RepID=B8LZV9_TALSN|nr:plasma membrane protein Pth11-like, putative [Talaromyces stipitatus ATCC 10500]EED20891.1 plasma membrane protein Pth11-like, putative [Talaromyces stipitatus ATCC 10500]
MPLFSHYGDLPDISYCLSYLSLFFSIFTPIIVIARLVSRKAFARKVGVDDWTILASAMFAEVVSIQMIFLCEWSFGKHVNQLQDKSQLVKTLKVYFVAQILYKVNIGLTKISILLLYLRIFVVQWFQRTCQAWIAIVIIFTIGTVISSIFQCTPVTFAFDKSEKGTCINLTAFWYANAAFNIPSDLVIIFLPIPVIRKLQLPPQQKFLLSGTFAVGIFVCITSILRITTLDIATSHLDVAWNSIASSMWTIIEFNLGIFCASLPAFRSALSSFFPAFFGRVHSATDYESRSRPRINKANMRAIDQWNELHECDSRTHIHSDLVNDSDSVQK